MGDALAPVIVFVTGILTTGAVLILRPISLKLGGFLEALTERNRRPSSPPELNQIKELLTGIDSRLAVLEERQDFAEALISAGDPRLLGVQGVSTPQDRH
jgi:hypothetical protein